MVVIQIWCGFFTSVAGVELMGSSADPRLSNQKMTHSKWLRELKSCIRPSFSPFHSYGCECVRSFKYTTKCTHISSYDYFNRSSMKEKKMGLTVASEKSSQKMTASYGCNR